MFFVDLRIDLTFASGTDGENNNMVYCTSTVTSNVGVKIQKIVQE